MQTPGRPTGDDGLPLAFRNWIKTLYSWSKSRFNIISVTSAYTVAEEVYTVLADGAGGAFSVTLPSATNRSGREIFIKRINAGANAITIAGTVDGVVNPTLATQYDFIRVISNGTSWYNATLGFNGYATTLTKITTSLGADVALNNIANYFDGPSVAQGTTGTWFASGTVTLLDTTAASTFLAKLWDGTTIIATAAVDSRAISAPITISLSGYLASPASNLRISVRDASNTTGAIKFNNTGNSKDSTISAIRIA